MSVKFGLVLIHGWAWRVMSVKGLNLRWGARNVLSVPGNLHIGIYIFYFFLGGGNLSWTWSTSIWGPEVDFYVNVLMCWFMDNAICSYNVSVLFFPVIFFFFKLVLPFLFAGIRSHHNASSSQVQSLFTSSLIWDCIIFTCVIQISALCFSSVSCIRARIRLCFSYVFQVVATSRVNKHSTRFTFVKTCM